MCCLGLGSAEGTLIALAWEQIDWRTVPTQLGGDFGLLRLDDNVIVFNRQIVSAYADVRIVRRAACFAVEFPSVPRTDDVPIAQNSSCKWRAGMQTRSVQCIVLSLYVRDADCFIRFSPEGVLFQPTRSRKLCRGGNSDGV